MKINGLDQIKSIHVVEEFDLCKALPLLSHFVMTNMIAFQEAAMAKLSASEAATYCAHQVTYN